MAVELRKLLQLAVDKEAGELRFTVGAPPSVRLRSGLRPLNLPVLTPEDTLRFLKGMAPVTGMQEFKDEGACSFDFAFDTTASFRVTAFLQEGHCSLTATLVPHQAPVIRDLDRRLSRRLDMPLRPYSSDLRLALSAAEFASSFGFSGGMSPEKAPRTLFASYRDKKYERPVKDEAHLAAELCRFILDVLDGSASAQG